MTLTLHACSGPVGRLRGLEGGDEIKMHPRSDRFGLGPHFEMEAFLFEGSPLFETADRGLYRLHRLERVLRGAGAPDALLATLAEHVLHPSQRGELGGMTVVTATGAMRVLFALDANKPGPVGARIRKVQDAFSAFLLNRPSQHTLNTAVSFSPTQMNDTIAKFEQSRPSSSFSPPSVGAPIDTQSSGPLLPAASSRRLSRLLGLEEELSSRWNPREFHGAREVVLKPSKGVPSPEGLRKSVDPVLVQLVAETSKVLELLRLDNAQLTRMVEEPHSMPSMAVEVLETLCNGYQQLSSFDAKLQHKVVSISQRLASLQKQTSITEAVARQSAPKKSVVCIEALKSYRLLRKKASRMVYLFSDQCRIAVYKASKNPAVSHDPVQIAQIRPGDLLSYVLHRLHFTLVYRSLEGAVKTMAYTCMDPADRDALDAFMTSVFLPLTSLQPAPGDDPRPCPGRFQRIFST